jgi:F0F1-type ATP synthase membrane subunit b/b'
LAAARHKPFPDFPAVSRHRIPAKLQSQIPAFVLVVLALTLSAPWTGVLAASQPHAGGDSWWPAIAKATNFAVLVGVLVYFLRGPVGTYFKTRTETIRRDLVEAAKLRTSAESQLAAVRARVESLPGELEALRRRGQEELAAERTRMKDATARERDQLIERTRRDIERQVRLARRTLTEHAARRAMDLARVRVERQITPEDQARLIDRYVSEVRA